MAGALLDVRLLHNIAYTRLEHKRTHNLIMFTERRVHFCRSILMILIISKYYFTQHIFDSNKFKIRVFFLMKYYVD